MLKYHIQTIEVGSGGTDSIDFTNISQEYDDLYITLSHRLSGSSDGQQLVLRFNGSATGYYRRLVYSYYPSSTGDYAGGSNETHSRFTFVQHSGTTANSFGNASLYIFDYTSSTAKSFGAEAVVASNSDTYGSSSYVNYWDGTSPITSVSLSSLLDGASFAPYSSASLYGIKHGTSGDVEAAADGGAITQSGGYTIHTFTSSGTFVANKSMTADVLVVGGGGGGANIFGGGGAGGYLSSSESLSAGTSYSVIVGAGGNGGGSSITVPYNGANGNNSSFKTLNAVGGGGGGAQSVGLDGGSGGGGGDWSGTLRAGGSSISGQGNDGGSSSGQNAGGGGGGGASQAGANGTSSSGGAGGNGSQWVNGSYYAGGGGGGAYTNIYSINGGAGGTGGGGAGGTNPGSGAAGTANTGGGGGGGTRAESTSVQGGNGGSGVVIIRYPTPA